MIRQVCVEQDQATYITLFGLQTSVQYWTVFWRVPGLDAGIGMVIGMN